MAVKTDTEVIIGGKVFTLSGYESEEYLQKHLTGEDLQQFQQFRDAELNMSHLSDFDNFAEGFRLGALLILDIWEAGA